jgi:hypothetical protein
MGFGVIGDTVNRDTDDTNTVIVTRIHQDTGTAKAFVRSKDPKPATEKAGVADPPETWFGEDIKHTQWSGPLIRTLL